jgi:hypothetical protein
MTNFVVNYLDENNDVVMGAVKIEDAPDFITFCRSVLEFGIILETASVEKDETSITVGESNPTFYPGHRVVSIVMPSGIEISA